MGFYKDVENVGLMKFYYEFIRWFFGNGKNVNAKGFFKFKAYFFGHALMLEVAFVSYSYNSSYQIPIWSWIGYV